MQVERDAFTDLSSIRGLICKKVSGGCHGVPTPLRLSRSPQTPAVRMSTMLETETSTWTVLTESVLTDGACCSDFCFYTLSKHFSHSSFESHSSYKQPDNDLSLNATLRTRPIHPSIHSSSLCLTFRNVHGFLKAAARPRLLVNSRLCFFVETPQ